MSNFYPVTIEWEGLKFPSVEHAYQAAKTLDLKKREFFTFPGLSPAQAKKAGQPGNLILRPGWEDLTADGIPLKAAIMKELLEIKYSYSILRRKLYGTMNAKLVEGNWWHDVFFGVCDGSGRHRKCPGHEPYGENWLGRLQMEIRDRV